jgi:hypothetical protein
MGYSTDFEGSFTLDKPLTKAQLAYLNRFSSIRHMGRNASLAEKIPDPLRIAVGLPIGQQGEYFVEVKEKYGFRQGTDESVLDENTPPSTQPTLWCQWVMNEEVWIHDGGTRAEAGTQISWDGGEKFYCYVKWLEYIIKNFLIPWGYKLNGKVKYQGERDGDKGTITVKDNVVKFTGRAEGNR